jgi:hypothetical protein
VFLALQDPDDDNVPVSTRLEIARLREQYRFLHWHLAFPEIFAVPPGNVGVDEQNGWAGGFSCVVANPPWEMLQLEDKQFFDAHSRSDIADAKNAAARMKMIQALAGEAPGLATAYRKAQRDAAATTHFARGGRFPLTASGKINTYSVFAETIRAIVGPQGASGVITPTGLATDNTTAPFFADTLKSKRLLAFYDFENEAKIFAGVDHRVRFAITTMSGSRWQADRARLAFLTRYVEQIPERRFELSADEVLAINPNTGTLPMFRTRTDAEITLGVYARHPVLIRDGGGRNPWGLSFSQGLFNMASDSGVFLGGDTLADATFNGWSFLRDEDEYLPLYEAKMLGHFDHRFSTYRDATQAQLNVGSLPRPTAEQHDDPETEPLARYWVARPDVTKSLAGRWVCGWLLGWRDITNATNERTFVPSVLPTSAVGDPFLLAFPADPADGPLLHATWSSLAFDYVARQKLSGTHMKYFTVKQLACPTPATFAEPAPWQPDRSLADWVVPYVLELSYTSWRLQPYAQEMHDDGPPFRWDPERRALLRADLDAAFLHVYGLTRPEAEHVLDSFFVVRKYEERDHGEFRTKRLVLDAYDRMAAAIAGGEPWSPLADLPAGSGPRHPAR